ncbi:carbamate kinase [Brucella anthropi]|jgi:carbamate kinase|uniref:carbamate kinase n=1 Tax=Brucella TaxID=234 RepID=UPI000A84F64A|nr:MULTISPECIES: carbamate kinase [Brucella]KAB2722544.1 carbamate kinase [Brucella intermedia]KAB2774231.1 carbamate kinase [Brucella anthropi]
MRVVVALGGNALLKRGEPMTADAQRANVRKAAASMADLARDHDIVVAHGNGPQVGLLALQAAAYKDVDPYPLDILGAESVGMIGYLVEQELTNAMPAGSKIATLLTQIEVDRDDPAFSHAEKPIGPVYTQDEAVKAKEAYGWPMVEEAEGRWRRVVPSPLPQHITQIETIRLLVEAGVTVICAGGGGIPVMREADGTLRGLEAVIDKDRAACLLAKELGADAFLMLTDVDAVYEGWGTADKRPIGKATPTELNSDVFAAGSMRPKVEAACDFANAGGISGIGRLEDARGILEGRQGTLVTLQAINQAS